MWHSLIQKSSVLCTADIGLDLTQTAAQSSRTSESKLNGWLGNPFFCGEIRKIRDSLRPTLQTIVRGLDAAEIILVEKMSLTESLISL
jgi:hypothetical protein